MRISNLLILTGILFLIMIIPVNGITWTSAGGCWTATDGIYDIIMWNTTGRTTWTATFTDSNAVITVIAAGGQGGMSDAGGGGAGGVISQIYGITTGTTYNLTVGNNLSLAYGAPYVGGSGGNSSFGNITTGDGLNAKGGGGGGGAGNNVAAAGGSGGGGSYYGAGYNASGISGQGRGGGIGINSGQYPGGGGGGNSTNGQSAPSNTVAGSGGRGFFFNTSTESFEYACGGGGSLEPAGTAGAAGCTGAGAGGQGLNVGKDATPATGHGGGGGGSTKVGGAGGSGIIFLRYSSSPPVASFYIKLIDTSSYENSFNWTVQNLLGNNTEVAYSSIQNPNLSLGVGNWIIKLTAINARGTSSVNATIGINLTSPKVYFWNRTG